MAIFEVLYKKQGEAVDVSSVKAIKHGFYFPYFFPIITLAIAIRQGCLFLGIWSMLITAICISLGHTYFAIFLKVSLLIAFSFFVPDIKKFDFIRKGYVMGGFFVEKYKTHAIENFFSKI